MRLRPSLHDHPDQTLVYASFLILKALKEQRIMPYNEVLDLIKNNIKSGEYLFLPALNFLFLLGLINYHPKTYVLEYLEKKS